MRSAPRPASAATARRFGALASLPQRWNFPPKAADFMSRDVKKGPALGAALAAAEAAWVAAGFPGDAAGLDKIASAAVRPKAERQDK